ncbi:CaiB/BaiF CoA-transferase family protein [Hydrogenophaga sp.]|uniref:CaiB/BaiF CoA transferase family protein n=1 Tax=Hydrogenophaga sp. TaxID=1904254 RepID=UPI00271F0EDC|nr:CaiB/BaiF CoA-transferase family protein [Hydrogenophaga sp.]MDO9433922.1 CaiB/BaiF CoA-transferase family protein [Hydrogenophaga sp.]
MKPLNHIHVIEFEGIGPGPLCGRVLADMCARVTVIARPGTSSVVDKLSGGGQPPLREGKQVVELNLKNPDDVKRALDLVASADALIEGNRPGVMERLGLGPVACAAVNPKLVYGRMTGWGQEGPLAQAAGHDINYVALSGMLSLSAVHGQVPVSPPTVLGDAGGALGLALGIVSGVLQARQSGQGCVVDAAIVDVVAMLGGLAQWIANTGGLVGPAPSVFHDSPFYDVYRCADGGFVTLGAIEPQFYVLLIQKLGFTDVDPATQFDTATWPALKERVRALFLTQPRQHWCDLLEGTDACFAPVLSLEEAAQHPHNAARGVYAQTPAGERRTSAAPRFTTLQGAHTHD